MGAQFLDSFQRWGGGMAYVFPRGYRRERWSYESVAGIARKFAREMASRNIAKGDAVLLWSPNCAEWVAAFLACSVSGVIAVPVDDGSSPDFVRRVSERVRTKLVLCSPDRASLFAGLPTLDPAGLAAAVDHHSAEGLCPGDIQPSDPLEIVFTSGTTADPKGVVLTHANVAGNLAPLAAEIDKYLRYERFVHPLRFLNLLPLSHVFGQFLGIFLPPLLGATVVFENTFNPVEIISTIQRERVSVLVAVPRLIDSLKRQIERDVDADAVAERKGGHHLHQAGSNHRSDFAARYALAAKQHFLRRWWTFRHIRRWFGWKFWAIISGGAALEHETEEFWHRLGYAVIQGYGLTETTSLISLNHPFHTSRGSIGKVLPGREIKLAADGEILVRGSGVASSYWNGHELAPVAGEEGWYCTGDLGELDADGNLFFKGRKKEVIVTAAGMNVYPQDLEAALRAQPDVRDSVVVGVGRGRNSEPCAVLILRDPRTNAKAVVAQANKSLAEYQRIRTWFVWPGEDFPRTSTGKPRRNVVCDVVADRMSEGVDEGRHESTASPLSELLARLTGRAAPKLSPDADLKDDLGMSSLERVELLGALEDRYQVDLSEARFSSVAKVSDLEKLLRGESRVRREFHYPGWTLRRPAQWVRLAVHYFLLRPAVFLLGWPRIVGRENLRGVDGPLLVISNHIDDVDVGFIQTALPGRIRHRLATATGGEALEALRSPAPTRFWFLRLYDRMQWMLGVLLLNLFPLPREAGFRKSFAYAGEAVDRGYSVLVFPEGRHTEDGKLGPFQTGVGLLANNLRVPVLPVRIDGLFDVKKAGRRRARPGMITLRIGKPLQFEPGSDPATIARDLRQAVQDL